MGSQNLALLKSVSSHKFSATGQSRAMFALISCFLPILLTTDQRANC